MTYKYSLLLICFLSMSAFSQETDVAENTAVDVILSSGDDIKKKSKTFNPNGIRLTPQPASDLLKLEFVEAVNNLSIEIIDKKGKVISQFRGEEVAAINFDTKALYQGTYFMRISSATIEDFLRFEIR